MDELASPGGFQGAFESFLWTLLEEGYCIVAETARLADLLPADFSDPAKSKYKQLLFDFTYFDKRTHFDTVAQQNEDLDESLYDEFGSVLDKFELLFNTVANFVTAFTEYAEQADSQPHLQTMTLEKELEVECVYVLGLVLLHLERRLPGKARERLLVAIHRNSDDRQHVEFLVDFLRAATNELDNMFKRVPINAKFIAGIVDLFDAGFHDLGELRRLRLRLSECLFVCLQFQPKTLAGDASRMRKLCENYYREQWVLCLDVGLLVNLVDEWGVWKAAGAALASLHDPTKARQIAEARREKLAGVEIPQGAVHPSQFASHLATLQQLNSALKWLVVHTHDSSGKRGLPLRAAADSGSNMRRQALRVMVRVGEFEAELFKSYRHALATRSETAKTGREKAMESLEQIRKEIDGEGGDDKNSRLSSWFSLMQTTLEECDMDRVESAHTVQHMSRRIAQVCEMLDLSSSTSSAGRLSLAGWLDRVQKQLNQLAAVLEVEEKKLKQAERAAEAGYAWTLIVEWTPSIQQQLLSSSDVQPVRALFAKLALAVTGHVGRMRADGGRAKAIGRAYSSQLERRLRGVLQSIPRQLFTLLKDTVLANLPASHPPTVEKTELRSLADSDRDFVLAEAAYRVSNMSVGVSRMALKKLGTIEVRPRQLLIEGLERELAGELPALFTTDKKELDAALSDLSSRTSSFRAAFIYLCEQMGVDGWGVWAEETRSRMEQWEKEEKLERRRAEKTKTTVVTPLGHLLDLILAASAPGAYEYHPAELAWKDIRYKKTSLSADTWERVEAWLPSTVGASLDRILATLIGQEMDAMVGVMRSSLVQQSAVSVTDDWLTGRGWEQWSRLSSAAATNAVPILMKIGQLSLVRGSLSAARQLTARLRATAVIARVERENGALLSALSSDAPPKLADLLRLFDRLQQCALADTDRQLYKLPSLPSGGVLLLVCMLVNILPRFTSASRRDHLCPSVFLSGLGVFCRQLDCSAEFSRIVSLYVDALDAGRRKERVDGEELVARLAELVW